MTDEQFDEIMELLTKFDEGIQRVLAIQDRMLSNEIANSKDFPNEFSESTAVKLLEIVE